MAKSADASNSGDKPSQGPLPAAKLSAPFDQIPQPLHRWAISKPNALPKLADVDCAAKPLTRGSKADDQARIAELGVQLGELQNALYAQGVGGTGPKPRILLVLQGMDTSGKDGTIRSVFANIDPLGVRAVPWKAPNDTERAHDYLWRIHQQVPAAGEIVIFNRSHYEDVLVPVVEGWIVSEQHQQRLQQIVDFERMLTQNGTTIIKCLLWISNGEQRERLQARIDDPSKHWKFSPGDLKVREKWDQYMAAYQSLLEHTGTAQAPWFVVPADSKTQRNLIVAEILASVLKRLDPQVPPANPAYRGLVVP